MSPATRSDLSGTPLEGHDDPIPITISFPEGPPRKLTVSAEEARSLALKGQEAPGSAAQALTSVTSRTSKVAGIVALAFLTGLLVPALVNQWSDRQKELDLKNGLITAITELLSETTANAVVIKSNITPEARLSMKAKDELAQANAAERDAAKTKLITAVDAEVKAEQTLFNQTIHSLLKNGGAYQARLATYFEDTDVPEAWRKAREAVRSHLLLTTGLSDESRRGYEKTVLDYLCAGEDGKLSRSGPIQAPKSVHAACASHVDGRTPSGNEFPFVDISYELPRLLHVTLLSGIRKSNADGYSRGLGDLAGDLWP